MKIKIIAAMDENRAIGKNDDIPWSIPEEQKHFKNETVGSPVIMGRKTFYSIKNKIQGPLPDRHSIVLSSDDVMFKHPNVTVVNGIDEAIDLASQIDEEVYVAGGESVYPQFIGMADEMILSIVDKDVHDADSYFPQFDRGNWEIVERKMNNDFSTIYYKRV